MKQKAVEYQLKANRTDFDRVQITNSKDVESYVRQFYFDDIGIYESFFIILLDRANKVKVYVKISQGGIAGTVVDPLIVAKYVVDSLAKGVILCHNHPSGNLTPSQQDIAMTNKIKSGLAFFDVNVIEHLILTEDYFYSFADNGLI
jgi:DNA repair protein RadC